MLATIDVGSNTVRMLVGTSAGNKLQPISYYRQITRLGGGLCAVKGLTAESMQRTLSALIEFRKTLKSLQVSTVRMVGTAALRRAVNRTYFVARVKQQTGLDLEIISGEEEARLTAAGALAAISPQPEYSLIIDIGGGSSELIWCHNRQLLWQNSYPLGVVRLAEEYTAKGETDRALQAMFAQFTHELSRYATPAQLQQCQFIGTAGTATTLAALQLQMTNYDWRKINNQQLDLCWLTAIDRSLQRLSIAEREKLPGMEAGRGDLILPGLQTIIGLLRCFEKQKMTVADFGLLEGLMLSLSEHRSD